MLPPTPSPGSQFLADIRELDAIADWRGGYAPGSLLVMAIFFSARNRTEMCVVYSLVQQHDQTKDAAAATANAQSATTAKQTNKVTGTKMQDFTPTSTPQTQLKIEDTKIGTGATVQAGDTVTADYVGVVN